MNEGWVWLRFPCSGLSEQVSRPIIKIKNKSTKESIYCEARHIEKNYEAKYRKGNTHPLQDGYEITMNEWYRKKLGIHKTQKYYDLSISYSSWRYHVKACCDHPQVVVRLATRISILSLSLGFIGAFPIIFSYMPCFVQTFFSTISSCAGG